VTYNGGSRYLLTQNIDSGTTNYLDVSRSNQIPYTASEYYNNNTSGGGVAKLFLDGPNFSGPFTTIPNGQSALVFWNTNIWQWTTTNAGTPVITAYPAIIFPFTI